MRRAAIPNATSSRSSGVPWHVVAIVVICATGGVVGAGCSGGSTQPSGRASEASSGVRLSITPAGGTDTTPNRGITVSAVGGRIGKVIVRTGGDPVSGTLNAARTVWRSTWTLDVAQRYTVTATAAGTSRRPVTRTSSFRTFKPKKTFSARVTEGYRQTYGVGMPIILSFNRPITNRAAVERALEIRTSKRIVGAWYWDSRCRLAPLCLYFRPRRYWPPHTRVNFTGHLDGVEAAAGVYGAHTLTQKFTVGAPLTTVVNTAGHYMNVYRDGKRFAHWPVSSGRPGDETPNGTYLTIEKANPVDMVGPGYNIEVPWSVRITWSGDYLHDAYWSVGDQGFSNVSHGCVNMSPANAETYYKMAVPGDPVKITGSPRAGTWDNGWTVWFPSWKRWLRGSALHEAVRAGPQGSTFVSTGGSRQNRHRPARRGRAPASSTPSRPTKP